MTSQHRVFHLCNLEGTKKCQKYIGQIMWLSNRTRPDVSSVLGILASLAPHQPAAVVEYLNHLWAYLKGTKAFVLGTLVPVDRSVNLDLHVYTDASHGGDGGRGRSGVAIYLRDTDTGDECLLQWTSKRQNIVAVSAPEAELAALAEGSSIAIFLNEVLKSSTAIQTDNALIELSSDSAVAIAQITHNQDVMVRSRTFKIKLSYMRDVAKGTYHYPKPQIQLNYLPGAAQKADGLTKVLAGTLLKGSREMYGLVLLSLPPGPKADQACLDIHPPPGLETQRATSSWDMPGNQGNQQSTASTDIPVSQSLPAVNHGKSQGKANKPKGSRGSRGRGGQRAASSFQPMTTLHEEEEDAQEQREYGEIHMLKADLDHCNSLSEQLSTTSILASMNHWVGTGEQHRAVQVQGPPAASQGEASEICMVDLPLCDSPSEQKSESSCSARADMGTLSSLLPLPSESSCSAPKDEDTLPSLLPLSCESVCSARAHDKVGSEESSSSQSNLVSPRPFCSACRVPQGALGAEVADRRPGGTMGKGKGNDPAKGKGQEKGKGKGKGGKYVTFGDAPVPEYGVDLTENYEGPEEIKPIKGTKTPELNQLNYRQEIKEAFDADIILVPGGTGSGKSVGLPVLAAQYRNLNKGENVVVVNSKRNTTTSLCRSTCKMWGVNPDANTIAYSIGADDHLTDETKILYTTDTWLQIRHQNQTFRKRAKVVFLDEFQEGTLAAMYILATSLRDKLANNGVKQTIVLMSATMNIPAIQSFIQRQGLMVKMTPDAAVPHHVSTCFSPIPERRSLMTHVCQVVMQALYALRTNWSHLVPTTTVVKDGATIPESAGDILVFFPTKKECETATRIIDFLLRARYLKGVVPVTLHGGVTEEQKNAATEPVSNWSVIPDHVFHKDAGLAPEDGSPDNDVYFAPQEVEELWNTVTEGIHRRVPNKVVFATPVAQNALTIKGVTVVVDTGLENRVIDDPQRRCKIHAVVPTPQYSLLQRKGRAGRNFPGVVINIGTYQEWTTRPHELPMEVHDKDIRLHYLNQYVSGEEPFEGPWLKRPSEATLAAAHADLVLVRSISLDNKATQKGMIMSRIRADFNEA